MAAECNCSCDVNQNRQVKVKCKGSKNDVASRNTCKNKLCLCSAAILDYDLVYYGKHSCCFFVLLEKTSFSDLDVHTVSK